MMILWTPLHPSIVTRILCGPLTPHFIFHVCRLNFCFDPQRFLIHAPALTNGSTISDRVAKVILLSSCAALFFTLRPSYVSDIHSCARSLDDIDSTIYSTTFPTLLLLNVTDFKGVFPFSLEFSVSVSMISSKARCSSFSFLIEPWKHFSSR